MDRLTKFVHILPIRVKYTLERLVKMYVNEAVSKYGEPVEMPDLHGDFGKNFRNLKEIC